MSRIISLPSNSICSLYLLTSQGTHARIQNPFHRLEISRPNHRWGYLVHQRMQSAIIRREFCTSKVRAVMDNNNFLSGVPLPLPPNSPMWATCILGSIVSVILTLWKLKGGFLQKIGNKVEEVEDMVEDVAEIVEDVAEVVEKVSSEVVDNLPEKGFLKDAASWVEQASKEVAKDARQALDFIHKVDELKEEVEKDWEELMEGHADEGEVSEIATQSRKEDKENENEEKEAQSRKEDKENENEEKEAKGEKNIEEKETQVKKENEEKETQTEKKQKQE